MRRASEYVNEAETLVQTAMGPRQTAPDVVPVVPDNRAELLYAAGVYALLANTAATLELARRTAARL